MTATLRDIREEKLNPFREMVNLLTSGVNLLQLKPNPFREMVNL